MLFTILPSSHDLLFSFNKEAPTRARARYGIFTCFSAFRNSTPLLPHHFICVWVCRFCPWFIFFSSPCYLLTQWKWLISPRQDGSSPPNQAPTTTHSYRTGSTHIHTHSHTSGGRKMKHNLRNRSAFCIHDLDMSRVSVAVVLVRCKCVRVLPF